jgi:hypothetical protein
MSSGFGYDIPAGGVPTVTQSGGRSGDVRFDASTGWDGGVPAGRILIPTGTLNAGLTFSFDLYNAYIGTTDMVIVTQQTNGGSINTAVSYYVGAHVNSVTSGKAEISVRNLTNSSLTDQIPLRFLIIKFT